MNNAQNLMNAIHSEAQNVATGVLNGSEADAAAILTMMRTRTPSATVEDVEEHPAESDEPQPTPPIGSMQFTSPAMTPEDWDRAHEIHMNQAGFTIDGKPLPCPHKRSYYKSIVDAAKVFQNKGDLEDLDMETIPATLFPLSGGGLADFAISASTLLEFDDETLKKVLDKCLEAHTTFLIPLPIEVTETQQKTAWSLASKQFMENGQDRRKTFEDYRLPPPSRRDLFDKTSGIQEQYEEFKTGQMFERVYTALTLFSDYQFAFTYCRILVNRYYDIAFHAAQTLVNAMHLHPDYCQVQAYACFVYDLAARLIQQKGDKYFEEVARMVTSGLYFQPTTKILPKVDHGGIPQPAPRNPQSAKLGDILEGLRFYGMQLTEDSEKISLDAAYNIVAYGNQLISKLDEMKDFNMDYVRTCIQIIEHGNLLHGIDTPTSIPENWPVVPPHTFELQGTPYRLGPGNAQMSYPDDERTIWTKECLICGRDHFTNEHEIASIQDVLACSLPQESLFALDFILMCFTQQKMEIRSLEVVLVDRELLHTLLPPKLWSQKKGELFLFELFQDRANRFIPLIFQHVPMSRFELLKKQSESPGQEEHQFNPSACDKLPMKLLTEQYPEEQLHHLAPCLLESTYHCAPNTPEGSQQFRPHQAHQEPRLHHIQRIQMEQDLHLEEEDQEELEVEYKITNVLAQFDPQEEHVLTHLKDSMMLITTPKDMMITSTIDASQMKQSMGEFVLVRISFMSITDNLFSLRCLPSFFLLSSFLSTFYFYV
ncbi:hypothetical protein M378DRAFT_18134 [Amanita muscaria Koide BX008]|uniref:Uncharacterized protein n=1 Tax=Amanita muscaria (strain Koide BX008) TaxID=946122 RepID=A0A0C2WF42_AMAMK|nr:hypothetical protein M378DRAFT_18134 [Amanita muscaria Koide BX008]